MILVDTSVMIDYLKGTENEKTIFFHEILNRKIPYGITKLIYLEILQGSKNDKEFSTLKKYLETLQFYKLIHGMASWENIAKINMLCRRKGISVRSTIDLIIAQTAIENELTLLHNDADYDRIALVVHKLKIYSP